MKRTQQNKPRLLATPRSNPVSALKGIETFISPPFSVCTNACSNPVSALKGIETPSTQPVAKKITSSNPVSALKGIETGYTADMTLHTSGSNPVSALKGIETFLKGAFSEGAPKFKPSVSPERD